MTLKPDIQPGPRQAAVPLALLASGAAAFGYEIVWIRMFSTALGHELPATLAVVSAFFIGLAAGAWGLDRVISRSPAPGRWYAGLEFGIAFWACITIGLVPYAADLAMRWTGPSPSPLRHWFLALLTPTLTLLPATAAMGATLIALDRLHASRRRDERAIGWLYGLNAWGSAAGVLAVAHAFLPRVGLRASLLVLAGLSAIAATLIAVGARDTPGGGAHAAEFDGVVAGRRLARWRLRISLWVTGLLGIGYQVIGLRAMSEVLRNSVFTLASILAMYLIGTAAGAMAYHRLARDREASRVLSWLLHALTATVLLGGLAIWEAGALYDAARATFGGGFAGTILSELVLAAAVFAPATLAMGATFSHLALASRSRGGGIGVALASNTLGGAVAPYALMLGLVPAVGMKITWIALAAAYLLLTPRLHRIATPLVLALVGIAVVYPPHLSPARRSLSAAAEVLEHRPGPFGAVSVVEIDEHTRRLMLNRDFQMGGTGAGGFAEARQAHIPLLLHAAPRTALFLGLGTGITFAAAAEHPELSADGVELVPEIVDALPQFASANAGLNSPRLTVHTADARRFVKTIDKGYDVIVADLFQPARDGSGSLYTREHFAAIRDRLAPGGIFCQWLPLYQLDGEVLALIVRTFLETFPAAHAVLCHFNVETPILGLIAGTGPDSVALSPEWLTRRGTSPELRAVATRFGLRDELQLMGTHLAGAAALRSWAGDGPLATDDQSLVTFRAPRADTRTHLASRTLVPLLDLEPNVESWIDEDSASFAPRLLDYVRARNRFLAGMVQLERGDEEQAWTFMLEAVRTTRDFRTAYEALLFFAGQRRVEDPATALRLLQELEHAAPERTEARTYRARWFPSGPSPATPIP